jgi:hypothetical protein
MMGRLNPDQEQLFYSFRLDEAVPHDHRVRKIAAVLDLSWVHSELAPFYPKMGRPSIDPELMIRMLIIGYIFAIRGLRRRTPSEPQLISLGHDARLMPAKYVRPYSRGQKNDFRDAEAIAEAVQRPTMKFVATKSAEQLDLQALHRVRERLVSQRTGIINQIRPPGTHVAGGTRSPQMLSCVCRFSRKRSPACFAQLL